MLRSTRDFDHSTVDATDGEIGQVTDCLVDDQTGAIRYLIVDTRNVSIGHHALIAPEWILGMSRESIKTAPGYDPGTLWRRELDQSLDGHPGRAGHWADSVAMA